MYYIETVANIKKEIQMTTRNLFIRKAKKEDNRGISFLCELKTVKNSHNCFFTHYWNVISQGTRKEMQELRREI